MTLRPYRTSILLAITFTVLLSTFWYLPQLAFIVFISLLLQLLLSPLVERLAAHLPRGVAASLSLLVLLLLLFALLTLVSSSILPTFTRFMTDFPEISEKVQELPLFKNSPILQDELDNLWLELKDASVDALKGSLAVFISLFSKAIDFVIILFVTFYLLKDGETIKTYLATRFPRRDYSRVLHLFNEILKALRAYIVSQLIICCITATIVFLYFTMRGLPYASVFAVVSGVCEFIPVLGPTVASAFGTILNIKPILKCDLQGRLVPLAKCKGINRAAAFIAESPKKRGAVELSRMVLCHADDIALAEKIRGMILEEYPEANVRLDNIGPVIGCHSGPGTIALFFLGDPKDRNED